MGGAFSLDGSRRDRSALRLTPPSSRPRADERLRPLLPAVLLLILFWLLYRHTATWAFSYDEFCDVLDIEFGPLKNWFHPNHLLPNFLGGLAFSAMRRLGYAGRSIFVLQRINFFLGSLAVAVFYEILRGKFGSQRALCGAALFGLSQAFWRGSVDANGYAWAGLAACLLVGLLLREPAAPFLEGLALGIAILFHEMFVFTVPAFFLRWRGGNRLRYLAGVLLAGGVPYLGLAVGFHGGSVHDMLFWLLAPAGYGPRNSIGSGSFWSLRPLANIVTSGHALIDSLTAPTEPASWLNGARSLVWALVLLGLAGVALRRWKKGSLETSARNLWVWILTMSFFQFFWQPAGMRFKILLLPALIVLMLDAAQSLPSNGILAGLALLPILVGINNANIVFIPESHIENNTDLVRTIWVGRTLSPGDCFLFSGEDSRSITNVCLAYFAPHLSGRSMKGFLASDLHPDLNALTSLAREARAGGHRLFFDADLLSPESQKTLEDRAQLPPGRLRAWLAGFHRLKTLDGPGSYRIIQAEI